MIGPLFRQAVERVLSLNNFAVSAAWTGWVPTWTCSGSMTFTSVTLGVARYKRIGKTVFFAIGASGTVGGTPSNHIYFTLPVDSNDATGWWAGTLPITNNATRQSAAWWLVGGAGSKMDILMYGSGNYTAGTVEIEMQGFYEVA